MEQRFITEQFPLTRISHSSPLSIYSGTVQVPPESEVYMVNRRLLGGIAP